VTVYSAICWDTPSFQGEARKAQGRRSEAKRKEEHGQSSETRLHRDQVCWDHAVIHAFFLYPERRRQHLHGVRRMTQRTESSALGSVVRSPHIDEYVLRAPSTLGIGARIMISGNCF
jgi:hypothetical protein